jgi:hypothetical protein
VHAQRVYCTRVEHTKAYSTSQICAVCHNVAHSVNRRPAKRVRHDNASEESSPALTLPSSRLQGLRNFPHQEGKFATTVFIPGRKTQNLHCVKRNLCAILDQEPHLDRVPFAVRFNDAQRAVMQNIYDRVWASFAQCTIKSVEVI